MVEKAHRVSPFLLVPPLPMNVVLIPNYIICLLYAIDSVVSNDVFKFYANFTSLFDYGLHSWFLNYMENEKSPLSDLLSFTRFCPCIAMKQ